ncbi:hypothetical protein GGI06_000227 [Coemansia sp. S85]|nr:hypothetical protein GGI06_000227 [Coemansia sp. S85]
MVIDWFPTHIFKERQRTKTAAHLSNAKPVVQSASPKESLPAKPSPVQRKDKAVDTPPMPHSEQVDMKGVTALLDGAKRCVEISQTKTRLADFPAATMAAPLSVSLPPIIMEGLVCRPCSWLEGVTVGDTVVRAAANSVAEISGITLEAAKKLGLTILMGGQQHQNPTCLKASPTVVGYVEAPVGVTGRKKRWVRAEVLEEPQPWDLLLGEAPVLTRDVIPNAPAKRKRRRTQKRKGPLTTSAESPSDETRDSHGESQLLAVKKAVVAVDNSSAEAVVDGAITSDFKTAAENDKRKRVEDERIADSPLQAFAKRKRALAGTGYTFCNTPQTEASAAIPIVGAKGSQCLANADALFEARPVHSYTDDEGSSDSDYSLVDDMLITEIRPDTGEIVCRRVPITYKSSASQN